MSLKQKLLLGAIILLAIFFRFYLIREMPGGLFPDEAANGLDVNLMQQGHLQPFYERGNGREALFFYMEWGSTALFGKGQWQFHIVSSLIGVLSVLALYFVTYRLFMMDAVVGNGRDRSLQDEQAADDYQRKKNRAITIALLAAFLLAVSTWHVVISHAAFRANLIPLISALTIYFLLRTYQSSSNGKKLLFACLAGAAFALGFYTYIAFRIMVAVVGATVAWPLLAQIKQGQFWRTVINYKLLIIGFVIAFAVVFFPIGRYFYQHPGSFVGRAGQVSIFNPELYTIDGIQLQGKPPLIAVLSVFVEVVKTQLLGLFTHGDLNWRQNISGYPMLSPLYSLFFGVGLLITTWLATVYFFRPGKKSRYWKYFLLAVWFWGMLLPVASTAEGIPHGLRGIGMLPPIMIISAWVLYEFAQLIVKFHKKLWQGALYRFHDPQWMQDNHFTPVRMRVVNVALKAVVVCFCLALVLQTYFLYFVYAANSPEYFYAFRADLTPVSEYLRQHCDKANTYLILDKYSVQTTDYLTSDPKGNFADKCSVPYIQVDPENSWQLPPLTGRQEAVFTQSTIFDTFKFKQYHPEAHLYMELRNQFNQDVMAVYRAN